MTPELKILILEDSPEDAELIQRELRRGGVNFRAVVASDERDFFNALNDNGFHAVLSDNALPQYSSIQALKLVKAIHPESAFILVTGTVSEEFAVKIIQEGADDYILKTNLVRLPTALMKAIERRRTQQEMEQERNLSVEIINSLPGIFYLFDLSGRFVRWNRNFERVSMYSFNEVARMKPWDFFRGPNKVHSASPGEGADVVTRGEEVFLIRRDGQVVPYLLLQTETEYGGNRCLLGIGMDISEGKKSEMELKEMNEQLRSLSHRMSSVREEEQKRIAREIHDELGQQLTGLKMDLHSLKTGIASGQTTEQLEAKFANLFGLVDETIKSIRKIASELRPSMLDDLGLAAALEWQSHEFARRFNIETHFYADEASKNLQLDVDIATGVFRIFQESLTNIARHAGPCTVRATMMIDGENLVLVVSDNGHGFSSNSGTKKTLGLVGMRERANMMGANVEINSIIGKGTDMILVLPLHRQPS